MKVKLLDECREYILRVRKILACNAFVTSFVANLLSVRSSGIPIYVFSYHWYNCNYILFPLQACCSKLYSYLRIAPYQPEQQLDDDDEDYDTSNGIRAMGVAFVTDKWVLYFYFSMLVCWCRKNINDRDIDLKIKTEIIFSSYILELILPIPLNGTRTAP